EGGGRLRPGEHPLRRGVPPPRRGVPALRPTEAAAPRVPPWHEPLGDEGQPGPGAPEPGRQVRGLRNENVTSTPASAVEVPPVIEARGITKQYGALTALQGVDLSINPGEIVGLVGDNGAGKSTLIKILSGAIQPTSGELLLDGRPMPMSSPLDARRTGTRTAT